MATNFSWFNAQNWFAGGKLLVGLCPVSSFFSNPFIHLVQFFCVCSAFAVSPVVVGDHRYDTDVFDHKFSVMHRQVLVMWNKPTVWWIASARLNSQCILVWLLFWWGCLSVCLSTLNRTFRLHQVVYPHCPVLLWQCCNTLCISGFADDTCHFAHCGQAEKVGLLSEWWW